MEQHRFDDLIRALSSGRSRRGALGMLSSLLVAPVVDDLATEAKKKKKKKKVVLCLNGQTIKAPKKNQNKFLLSGATAGACSTSPPPSTTSTTTTPPPAPTCTDGVQNGDETGVDCGGSCPRCANGQGCKTRADCNGALCIDSTCVECTSDPLCGSDGAGNCFCLTTGPGAPFVCVGLSGSFSSCNSSVDCDAGEVCAFNGSPLCWGHCGTS